MKNSLIKGMLAGAACLMLTTGCKKSFLEQQVPGALAADQFYKTDQDATQAVTAIYDLMTAHYNTSWTSLYMVKTMLSDESNAGGSGPGDQEGYQRLDDYTFDAQNDKVRGAWNLLYGAIYRANNVVNKVEPATELRKRLIGEAKFLRALNYLDLVSMWGDVPLVTKEISPSQFTTTPRAKKEEVYGLIVKDLQDAIAVLPEKSAYSVAEKFRASKGAAEALLGRAYLYQQKWSEAAAQLEAVINSNQYSLEPTIGIAFSKAGEFGRESLFELNYTDYNYNWGNFPWDWQPESNIHIQLMGPRSDYYIKAPSDSLLGGWGFNTPKKKLYDAFVAAGDENRRKQTVMSLGELRAMGGDWTTTNAWDFEGYFQRKYGSYASQTNTAGGNIAELNYGTNWRLIRYADVYLMAAEAQYRLNNEGKALGYINQVRRRSGLPDLSVSGNALFQALVTERELELAFEGFRFIDLVRWGLATQELGPLGFKTGKHEVLPIPNQDVLTAGLTQNPGY